MRAHYKQIFQQKMSTTTSVCLHSHQETKYRRICTTERISRCLDSWSSVWSWPQSAEQKHKPFWTARVGVSCTELFLLLGWFITMSQLIHIVTHNPNTIGFKNKCENPLPCSWEAILNLECNLTNKEYCFANPTYMYLCRATCKCTIFPKWDWPQIGAGLY